ncbi:MAG TPA: S8 family serine peptidase, partial [Micromonosporaceae bacterium]
TSNTATNTISGTSMASPHAAGVAALILAQNPSYTPAQVANKMVSDATTGVVTNPGSGSPNRLLYVDNGGGTPPTDDFSISVSPTSGSVTAGGSVSATVSTATTSGSAQSVSLSASGLPSGASASFSPSTVTSGGSSTMTISTSSSTPAGTYAVTITGTGSSVTRSTTYTLTVTSSGGSGCSGYEVVETGSLSSGQSAYHPGGSYFYAASGTHRACLDGPTGTDFDLYLQRWNGWYWSTVAQSISSGPDESITYSGSAGYYRYRVHAYSGSGSYTVGFDTP